MAAGKSSSNTSRNTQRQKLEAREGDILTAATSVFATHGVDGARMAEIARLAGVAEGTIYLYYRNKQELLAGVVGHFWTTLTAGAIDAIDVDSPAIDQLRQLAHYHLTVILDQFEVVALTYRARQGLENAAGELDQVRDYVRVYDQIIQRGIDRGEVQRDTPLWQSRDVFFGTLEFSARTLHLRGQSDLVGVIDNLMTLFSLYSVAQQDRHESLAKSRHQAPGKSPEIRLTDEEQQKQLSGDAQQASSRVSNEDLMIQLKKIQEALDR